MCVTERHEVPLGNTFVLSSGTQDDALAIDSLSLSSLSTWVSSCLPSSRQHASARHWPGHLSTAQARWDTWDIYQHTQQPRAPASQSAHPRRGGGSLRRRVLSECRVLARLEARPVTRLLGMERQRQGLPSSPWFEPTQGVAGLGQACRACQAGPGRKAAFRDSLFQDSFATTPFPPSRRAAGRVPPAGHAIARHGHGVTHAHSYPPRVPSPPLAVWGPASTPRLTTRPAR